MLINGGRVRISNCKYEINAATRAGGAVSVTKGSLEMADSSVISNYAGEADGMCRCMCAGARIRGERRRKQSSASTGGEGGHCTERERMFNILCLNILEFELVRSCVVLANLVVVLTNLVSCKLMLSLRLTTRHRFVARRAPSHLRTHSHMHAHTSGGVFVNGGEASFQGCSQDGNSIGHFASELLDQIQTRRQETYYSQNGFGDPSRYQYLNPLAIT